MNLPTSWPLAARSVSAVLALTVLASGSAARANGIHSGAGADEPLTRYERFTLSDCSPCVKEAHAVASVPAPSLKLASFPRMATGPSTRAGEIALEVVRAYPLGRPSRQRLALRVSLLASAGGAGETYRLATGFMDEDEIGALVTALAEITQVHTAPLPAGPEQMEIAFQSGSVRIGVVRFRSEGVAFVQVGDAAALALKSVWEVPTTMYLPAAQLSALAGAVGQAAVKAQKLRTGP